MKLKLSLLERGGETSDIAVTLEPSTTIGDIATALQRRDPRSERAGDGDATLALVVDGRETNPLVPDLRLLDTGIRSGETVRIVNRRSAGPGGGAPAGPKVATLRILEGPDAGKEFDLTEGTTYIGRGPDCDITLSDPMVSNQHAKLHVTTVPELVDTNSSNGVVVDNEFVPRAVLRPDDIAYLGDTAIAVSMHRGSGVSIAQQGTSIPFNRSPRVSPLFTGTEFESPDLPVMQQAQRLQIFPMVIPILMGGVMYEVTKNADSVLFVAMSPLMLGGNFFENRLSRKKAFERALEQFYQSIADLDGAMAESAEEEVHTRVLENPSAAELTEAVAGLRPLVWTRRPNEPGFLQVRLGLGPRPSRSSLKPPENAKQRTAQLADVAALQAKYSIVHGVPVVADLKQGGALGVSGDDDSADDLARCVVAQIVGLHSPAEVVVAALAVPPQPPSGIG